MHPSLAAFIGESFYGGALQSHASLTENVVDPPFPHYNSNFPTVVWNLPYMESRGTDDNLSITNEKQVLVNVINIRY